MRAARLIVWLFALAWPIAVPIELAAQATAAAPSEPAATDTTLPEQATAESVRDKMELQIEAFAAQSFQLATLAVSGRAGPKQPARAVARLNANTHYAFLAACDADCSQIVLSLLDGRGGVLVRSPAQADVAVVNGVPDRTGLYEIEIGVPGCRERVCHVALAVLSEGEAAAGETAVVMATSSAPRGRQPAPLPAAATFERATGQRLGGIALAQRFTASYPQCELLCLLDPRCTAAAYNRATTACLLHERAGAAQPDADADLGLKRQAQAR